MMTDASPAALAATGLARRIGKAVFSKTTILVNKARALLALLLIVPSTRSTIARESLP